MFCPEAGRPRSPCCQRRGLSAPERTRFLSSRRSPFRPGPPDGSDACGHPRPVPQARRGLGRWGHRARRPGRTRGAGVGRAAPRPGSRPSSWLVRCRRGEKRAQRHLMAGAWPAAEGLPRGGGWSRAACATSVRVWRACWARPVTVPRHRCPPGRRGCRRCPRTRGSGTSSRSRQTNRTVQITPRP